MNFSRLEQEKRAEKQAEQFRKQWSRISRLGFRRFVLVRGTVILLWMSALWFGSMNLLGLRRLLHESFVLEATLPAMAFLSYVAAGAYYFITKAGVIRLGPTGTLLSERRRVQQERQQSILRRGMFFFVLTRGSIAFFAIALYLALFQSIGPLALLAAGRCTGFVPCLLKPYRPLHQLPLDWVVPVAAGVLCFGGAAIVYVSVKLTASAATVHTYHIAPQEP